MALPHQPPPVTATLAQWLAQSAAGACPAPVLHEAKRSLLNYIGCALGGAHEPAVDKAIAALAPFATARDATLIGRRERSDVLHAAFFNAITGNVFDFDDTHLRTVIHPTAPVAPVLLAWAERSPLSGAVLLQAFALGVEVECRIGNAVSPGHYAHGWHITSTCGVFGAAAALGHVLGLDAQGMTYALGHAAAQSAGLVEGLGVDAKSVSMGNAARNGMVAALLAAQGFTGPAQALEGRFGFLNVLGTDADHGAITHGLGSTWELAQNTYKPYPCGVVLHPVIDACLDLRARHGIDAAAIARVTVRGHPLLRMRADRPAPATGRLAQVSLQHTIGVAFIDGRAGLAEYSDARVRDADVLALGARLAIIDDATLPARSAHVAVSMTDGRTLECHVEHALGSLGRPMTDAQIEAKCRALAAHGSPGVDVDRIIDAVWRLDQAPDAGALSRLLAAAP